MTTLGFRRPLLATAAVIAFVVVAISLYNETADAQSPPPQIAGEIQRLQGKHVIVYLQANIPGDPRRREESNGFARVNEVPVSITGTVADFASEGGTTWVVLSRQGEDAWIPVSNVQLIVELRERP